MDHPRQCLWLSLVLLSVASANWVYDWPYGARGECRCRSIEALTGAGFPDVNACLKSFSEELYEFCWTKDADGERVGGITERDCGQYAVTTHPAFTNMDCEVACLKVIVGSLSEAKFLQHCKLEPVVEIRNKVTTLQSGCFVNYVLGHADYNPTFATDDSMRPLRIFHEVRTAAKCQSLCQQLDDCAWFQWRAVPDDECNTPILQSFQRPPQTCELYSYKYVQTVLNFDVGFFGQSSSAYAGGVCDMQQFRDRGCNDIFQSSSWNPFGLHTRCLNCGCEQKCAFAAKTHVSGPAYCERGELTDVCGMKPPFEHTTPAPECSTIECEEETTSPAEEFLTTPTELTTVRTRPPTQPVFTTSPQENGKTMSTTATAEVVTEGGTQVTEEQQGGTSTSTAAAELSTTEEVTSTDLYTTESEETEETSTELYTSVDTNASGKERPCGPCPPCDCPPGNPDCQCECPPCPCTDDDCLDAHWEAEDFTI